jgi:hypothetical protein
MFEDFVDNKAQTVYNEKSDDVDEVIRMAGKTPLNDPNCEHEFVIDPTDVIGDAVAYVCHCGIGHFRPVDTKQKP